jgi:hypothetical protein
MDKYFEFNTQIFKVNQEDTNISRIIYALKDVIKTALEEGFGKWSNVVKNHVQYVKKIREAKNPEGYIRFTAKKLFPTAESFDEKSNKVRDSFRNSEALAHKILIIYELYYNILKEKAPPRRKISADEAEEILAELLPE